MANLNVDGLVSGLDTSSLVSQLMSIERQPQVRLQSRRTEVNNTVSAFQTLSTRLGALRTATEALTGTAGWRTAKASSTNDTIASVTATATASPATLSMKVTALAKAHATLSTAGTASVDDVVATSDITVAGETIALADLDSGSLSDVVAAINAKSTKVTASAVFVNGSYRLQLMSRSTGDASALEASGATVGTLGSAFGIVSDGSDATLQVGDGPGAYTLTSSTNSFTGALPGVTITARAVDPNPVTVTVSADPEALADKVQAMVTAWNDVSTYLKSQTSYDTNTKKSGTLFGEPQARALTTSLRGAAADPVSTLGKTASAVGITIDRFGVMSFNRQKFLDGYAADPSGTAALFQADAVLAGENLTSSAGDGIAERLRLVALRAVDLTRGQVTKTIQSRQEQIKSLDAQIAAWDTRLALRETALKRQFSNLEVALGRLQDQGNWLSSQVAGLMRSN
jgi:flagellar hook-associated protein 2